jgi:hypothetical protein
MIGKRSWFMAMLVLGIAALGCNFSAPQSSATGSPAASSEQPSSTLEEAAIPAVYAVVLVPEGGSLDLHTAAGSESPSAGSLAWDAAGLVSTGNVRAVGSELWVELEMPGGGTGWVDRVNLAEYMPPADFCADSRPLALFSMLGSAVESSSGAVLSSLVSPIHGLTVVYIHNGNPKVYSPAQVGSLFASSEVVDWGLGPGSGLPVTGSFADLVRPDLAAVLGASYTTVCNTIQLGGASYTVAWPPQWKNINFYSLYKPGSPAQEMDWMTWLVGVEYVAGQPYLFSLSRFNWEP